MSKPELSPIFTRTPEKTGEKLKTKKEKVAMGSTKEIQVSPTQRMATMINVASLKQQFDSGLCGLLTRIDIGPVECRQPESNEDNCPDIEHLRK